MYGVPGLEKPGVEEIHNRDGVLCPPGLGGEVRLRFNNSGCRRQAFLV